MKKKNRKIDKIEKKLKIENIERCLNCKLFSSCTEMKEEIVVCSKFKEIPIKQQLIVVSLAEYSKLKGTKNLTLCSFC